MSDSELIQAKELVLRYNAGTSALVQLIDHFSQRGRLEETIGSTIEKAPVTTTNRAGLKGFASLKFQPNTKDDSSSAEVNVLLPQLQREAENIIRMHMHLSGRVANEVVAPLEGFISGETWGEASRIQLRLQGMAAAMHAHHDQIPKISSRTVSKSARASQQAKQRLEDEKGALMALQNNWQNSVTGLVAQFEAADVARVKTIRESLLRFEHYRNEFYKAAQADIGLVSELTQQYQPSVRIVDALGGESQTQTAGASTVENDRNRNIAGNAPVSAPPNASGSAHPPLHSGESGDESAQIEAPSKSFLKLNIFRSKTKRVKKKSSGNGTFSGSSASTGYSHSVSSGVASPSIANTNVSIANPGVPMSIRTANTHSSNALSVGLPSEQRNQADTPQEQQQQQQKQQQKQQAADVADILQPQSPSPQQIQQLSPSQGTSRVHTSAGDFAEWVFADNTQETSSSRNNSNYSVGSMVHVSGSLAAIDEASDNSQQRSQPSIGISKQTSVSEPPRQAKASSSTAEFDSAFGSLQITSSPKPVSTKSTSVGESKQIDLDSAFNIPQAPQSARAQLKAMDRDAGLADTFATSPAPGNTRDMSFVDVFGSADVFKSTETKEDGLKKSPQMARLGNAESPRAASSSSGHRRSASVDVPKSPTSRAKGVEFDTGEKSGSGESSNDSDAYEDAETSFRVNFSIRESAIKDNPDESKAALSRVTTLLRSAPSVRRGRNRRDVRTMYVPSSVPIASAIEMQGPQNAPSSKDGADILAQIQDPQSDDAAVQMKEHASEPGVQDADVPITPITPMPVRPDAYGVEQTEALDTDIQPEAASEVPVATVTLPDTAAIVEADIAAAATVETITSEPSVESEPRNKTEAEEAPVQAGEPSQILEPPVDSAEPRTDDTLPTSIALVVNPEESQISEAVGALPLSSEAPSAAQPSTQSQKGEGPGRRRAPPPPPPPPPSVQQQISSSPASSALAEAKADSSPAENETPEQLQQQQLTSSKSVHRGRRAGVSTRPLPMSINVREIIDYEFAIIYKP
ncbi:Suppressor of Profilin deletion, partial [Coemansia sp. IMI 209127]